MTSGFEPTNTRLMSGQSIYHKVIDSVVFFSALLAVSSSYECKGSAWVPAFAGTHASGKAGKELGLFHRTQGKIEITRYKDCHEFHPKIIVWKVCGTAVHQNDKEITLALATCTLVHTYTLVQNVRS